MPELIEVCRQAALAGGAVLKEWVGRFEVQEKGPMDLVTEADLAAQEAVRKVIFDAFPDHDFVGEETADGPGEATALPGPPGSESEYRWIVDPLDGTTNYVHGVPHYATSVAVEQAGQLAAGAIYDPVLDEIFLAARGAGATLNGKPIHTSRAEHLSDGLVAASFPPTVDPDLPAMREFMLITPLCQGIRRGGSAALNLAYLACGRFAGYWAADLYAWDAAAGALLVQEAGGILTDLEGGAFDVWNPLLVAAGTQQFHTELRNVLRRAAATH